MILKSSFLIVLLSVAFNVFPADKSWYYKDWHSRIPVTVDSGMYERNDCIASCQINFDDILKKLKSQSVLDANSIRVTELNPDDNSEKETAFNYNSLDSVISWEIKGSMESMASRNFYIYFDVEANGKKPAFSDIFQMSTGNNLLLNGSFEEVTDGKTLPWQIISKANPGEITVTQKEIYKWERSICISKNGNETSKMYGYNGANPDIPVKPKTKYMISGWIKAEGKGRQVIQLFTMDANKNPSVYVMSSIAGAHDWMRIDKVLVTREDTRFAGVRFFIGSGEGCTAYFDEIELVELPEHPAPEVTVNEIEVKQ